MNGQCVIFRAIKDKENENNSTDIYMEDYSLIIKTRENYPIIDLKNEHKISNACSPVVNIYEPLSKLDWEKVCDLLKKVEACMFY